MLSFMHYGVLTKSLFDIARAVSSQYYEITVPKTKEHTYQTTARNLGHTYQCTYGGP